MTAALLSVVIPSFNCAGLLERAVRSAYSLAADSLEVIVVDDGSTDETPQVCSELVVRYPSLRVIRRVNGGLSAARNTGMDSANGEFIFLLDADDELIPFDLSLLEQFEGDVLRVGVEEILIDGSRSLRLQRSGPISGSAFLAEGLRPDNYDFYIPSWAYIYRRSFIVANQLRFAEGLIHEDMLFTIQALLAARQVAATDVLAYRYIRRPGSITQQASYASRRRRVASVMVIARELTALTNAHPEVDLWLWTSGVLDYGWNSGQVGDSRRLAWRLLLGECRFFLKYRLWGLYRSRSEVRWRLRVAATRFLFLRDPSSMGGSARGARAAPGRMNH